MKIAIIGAGNMGLSFSKSFLKYELIKPENLQLITRNHSKIKKISEEFPKSKISIFDDVEELDADLIIKNEDLLDGVTALSGSGPAYFYYIVDAMIKPEWKWELMRIFLNFL